MLREYYHIKQDSGSEEMSALLHFVEYEYDVPAESVKGKVVHFLNETDSPVEFIKRLEETF